MNVINIIDNLSMVNFGIWNAALSTSIELKDRHGIRTFLVAPTAGEREALASYSIEGVAAVSKASEAAVRSLISKWALRSTETVIASHGAWGMPTRLAALFSSMGFSWVYCPHGMLEPWSLSQKSIRKSLYWQLVEGRLVKSAKVVRAVSAPERDNLQKLLGRTARVALIHNGVPLGDGLITPQANARREISFLGRLHNKKCPVELLKAFCKSSLANNPGFCLSIVGPDDGEMATLQACLSASSCSNATVLGPVYGLDKINLLRSASYFALPSHSEGFPTSVVEALAYGCVPLISEGCNFPEAIDEGVALETPPCEDGILRRLESLIKISDAQLVEMRQKCMDFVVGTYSIDAIAASQALLFTEILT